MEMGHRHLWSADIDISAVPWTWRQEFRCGWTAAMELSTGRTSAMRREPEKV